MWFWSNGLGPGAVAGLNPATPLENGSAGPKLTIAKNAVTTNITISAQPTRTSSVRLRNRQATAAVKPVSTNAQSRIDPSSADHIAAKL